MNTLVEDCIEELASLHEIHRVPEMIEFMKAHWFWTIVRVAMETW
jgi:hypothetical protein